MSQDSARSPHHRSNGLWVVIGLILVPAVVIPLWVPLYDKTDPSLAGFPFFYWFQFAMILMAAALTAIAYALSLVADRRRAARGDRARGGDAR
jgi:uncharacterized membrane protein